MLSTIDMQKHIAVWVTKVFGQNFLDDRNERCRRAFEEAVELVQACGLPQEQAQRILEVKYSQEPGEIQQELGGAFFNLMALAENLNFDISECMYREYLRVNRPKVMRSVRAKVELKKQQGIIPEDLMLTGENLDG